jgi:hypothetical protein
MPSARIAQRGQEPDPHIAFSEQDDVFEKVDPPAFSPSKSEVAV